MKQVASKVSLTGYALNENGASLVEYSLLTGLISITIVAAVASISGSIAIAWSNLAAIVGVVAGA